jgi:hypothetical protein
MDAYFDVMSKYDAALVFFGEEIMNLWNKHKEFPKPFLAQYRDLVLYDIFHQIKALFLYPLNCDCKEICTCQITREKIAFL